MYILIRIGLNDSRSAEMVSKHKNKLVAHIKEKGYYFGKGAQRYIDDKTSGINGGSGVDYLINKIDELT